MRASNKSRSRNRNNNSNNNNNNRRNNGGGNVVNRVFDSAGPDGRVRGTPQQIIEKYSALAHDALLSDDRVGAESFQQHAEHYARMLVKAQKQQAERQLEQQEQQAQQELQRQKQAQAAEDARPQPQPQPQPADDQPDISGGFEAMQSPELVATPEAKVQKPRVARPRRKLAPKEDAPVVVTQSE